MQSDLSDKEWALLESLMPRSRKGARVDDRKIVSAVFYVLRTGIPWRNLPKHYGPYTTAYNRFNRWSRRGVWKKFFYKVALRPLGGPFTGNNSVKTYRAVIATKGMRKRSPSPSATVGTVRNSVRPAVAETPDESRHDRPSL
jgi:transposase